MTMERLKRKKTLLKMTGKQKIKHRSMTLSFMSITGMMRNIKKLRRTLELKNKELENQKIIKQEEIEKNEEITMVELQSENNEKNTEVV